MLVTMFRTRIYVGARVIEESVLERPSVEVLARALEAVGVTGATIYDARGIWRGLVEPTRVIEYVEETNGSPDAFPHAAERQARALVDDLRVRWPQESYLVTIEPVRAAFVA